MHVNTGLAVEYLIEGVPEQAVEENIALLLERLDTNDDSVNSAFWIRQVKDKVASAVEPFGYYNSTVRISGDDAMVILDVTLGNPQRVTSVVLELIGEGRQDIEFKQYFDNFPLNIGDIANEILYEQYKQSIFNYALANGYFDFAWQATRIDLVRQTKSSNLVLIAQSGPKYQFGPLQFSDEKKSQLLVSQIAPFSRGEPYHADLLAEFNRRLNQSGYYQRAIARPVVSQAKHKLIPIDVSLQHRPRDNFNLGIGFATDTGFRVPLRWERPWVNSDGHSVNTDIYFSQREQFVSAQYHIPMRDVRNDFASFQIGYQFLDDPNRGTNSETLSLSAQRYWTNNQSSNWRYIGSLSYEQETFQQGLDLPSRTNLLMPGISASYVRNNGDLNHREGFLFSASVQIGNRQLFSDISMVRATTSLRWLKAYGPHRLFVGGEIGAIDTNDFSRVPSTMRFFTGGDQSIRGFSFESISPGEIEQINGQAVFVPQGGQYLGQLSVEYAYPIKDDLRASVFIDTGTATNDFDEGLARGIGVGLHWLTMIGPVRVYLGFGESQLNIENSMRLHLIIGPEL